MNIDNIAGLCNIFIDTVNKFGKRSKSIQFYKMQLEALESHEEVEKDDIEFVKKLLGIVNTNDIKWNIIIKKLKQFKIAIDETNNYNNNSDKLMVLKELETDKIITKTISKLTIQALNLNSKEK